MAFRETIWLPHACGEHSLSLHGNRLSTRGCSERDQTDERHHGRCRLETSAYEGSANFDFNNVAFKPYANAALQSHADFDCSSNVFDCARANESGYNYQAS